MGEHLGTFGELIDTTVRVATWNLWWRFGPWEERLPAILATTAEVDADIWCLQEVWSTGGDSADGDSTARRIADQLGGQMVYAPMFELDGVAFGNAIVSRWPITSSDIRSLSAPKPFDENRNVLRADVDGPRGPIQVFSTHLQWRADHSHLRCQQVRELCEFVASSPPRTYPPVVCGDLNADPDSDEIRMLTGKAPVPSPPLVFWDAWTVAGRGAGTTWSNDNPYARLELDNDRRIDYVLTGFPKDGGRGHCTSARAFGAEAIDGVVPSDHYGVVTELRY